jgi:GNAT superfamily N-acetyltransferase
MISCISCLPGDADFKDFNAILPQLYLKGDISQKQNLPERLLVRCIIAYKDNLPAARIAIYDNPQLIFNDCPILLAGAFESIDDLAVVQALFSEVETMALQMEKKYIVGPMNGSTWEEYRIQIAGSEDLFFTEIPSLPYYHLLWERVGFSVLHKYYSSVATIHKINSVGELPSHIRVRNISLENFSYDLKAICDLTNKAFTDNPFFTVVPENEFLQKYLPLKRYIKEAFVLLAKDIHTQQLLAYIFALPDVYDKSNETLIIKTIAKHPSEQTKGLITVMLEELHKRAFEKGYRKMIHAFMHETNSSRKLSNRFEGNVFREYALLIKQVNYDNRG